MRSLRWREDGCESLSLSLSRSSQWLKAAWG